MAKPHRFTTLDALRGVAALVVALSHMPDATFYRLLPGAHLAVDFFFVLSGFVISDAYLSHLESGGLSFWRFMGVRIARLYPLYALALLLSCGMIGYECAANPSLPPLLPQSVVLSALFLPTPPFWSVAPAGTFPLNIPTWSLFWELAVNALLAFLVAAGVWRQVRPLLLPIAAALIVAPVAAHGSLDVGMMWGDFAYGAPRVFYPFFAGVLIHGLWRSGKLAVAITAPLGALLLLAIVATPVPAAFRGAFDIASSLVLLPLIVAGSTGETVAALPRRLGRASYGIYVLHLPMLAIAMAAAHHVTGRDLSDFGPLGSLAVVAAVIAVALWLDGTYDRWAVRQLRAIWA